MIKKGTIFLIIMLIFFFGCTSNKATIVTFSDGQTQNITINGKLHEIKAHIESEDKWASFRVDGSFGAPKKYFSEEWGNVLTLPGDARGTDSEIEINGVQITLLEVGYDEYNEEYAKVSLGTPS